MSDDNPKSDRRITRVLGSLGAYGELYPSLAGRLQSAFDGGDARMQQRMEALNHALADRDEERRRWLAQRYDLTPAETRVAIHLADGGSVAGYAAAFGVSAGTVRSQLKSIFAKTGINRQSALHRIMIRR